MRTLTRTLTLTGLLALVFSIAAPAQDTTVSKGDVARAPSFTSLMASYQHFPATLEALKKMTAIKGTDVTVVDATPLVTGESEQLLKTQLERHAAHITELQQLLSAQAEVTASLSKDAPGRTVADVIAADTQADGKVVLYVHPKKA
jgi:hypothetical protein